jgi:TatD DNase family protein
VIERMQAAGVAQAVVVATTPEDGRATRALCAGRAGLYATAGQHPNDVPQDWDAAELQAVLVEGQGDFCAIGETGLDYYRDAVPRKHQQRAFEDQIRLARGFDLPVIVHIRDQEGRWEAYDDVAATLERERGVRGVIHCYTGDPAHAERYLACGFYVSFSGILTFPKGANVREAARAVPLERSLVETDAPFLAPLPHRGARNEPGFVAHTCAALALLKGVSEAEARAATARNARALFGLPPAGSPTAPRFGRFPPP